MKFAKIINGEVGDIIVWDKDEYPSYDLGAGLVQIPDELTVVSGDRYDPEKDQFIASTPQREK